MKREVALSAVIAAACGCSSSNVVTGSGEPADADSDRVYSPWTLMLSHDRDGVVKAGSSADLVDAVRSGCQLRIAWGGGRADPPRRSVEHVAEVKWVTVRNGEQVYAQIGDFMPNLVALGEPEEDHPRREEFGGTKDVVEWRATLSTDGSFDAVWFKPHSGEFVTRRPQNHPMKWFADCRPGHPQPLYQRG
ncbi:MAG: hypothetical protein AAF756_12485 [Pseudomonadota bacterium]